MNKKGYMEGTYIAMEVGEQPEPGKLYMLKNQPMDIYRDMDTLDYFEEVRKGVSSWCIGSIPGNGVFMFIKNTYEQKVSKEIKRVWFQVIYKDLVGICYNGRIPFHQFLLKVTE